MTVGEYIVKRRDQLRLRQADLAQRLTKLGYPRSANAISSWETNERPVPVELFKALSIALEEPSPLIFYELAGVLDDIPSGEIVKLLRDEPQEVLDRAEAVLRAMLGKDHA